MNRGWVAATAVVAAAVFAAVIVTNVSATADGERAGDDCQMAIMIANTSSVGFNDLYRGGGTGGALAPIPADTDSMAWQGLDRNCSTHTVRPIWRNTPHDSSMLAIEFVRHADGTADASVELSGEGAVTATVSCAIETEHASSLLTVNLDDRTRPVRTEFDTRTVGATASCS